MYNPTKPHINKIKELIQQTWQTPCVSVKDGLMTKKFFYPEITHTDGIGSKGLYHWQQRSFKNAVIDALAMNLNDLAFMRAVPYAVIDHLMIEDENDQKAILEIITCLVKECKKRNIAITAGETAGHFYNLKGMELSIAMLGFIKNPKPNKFQPGDVLIGLESNGLHSNGFTKIRQVFGQEFKPDFIAPTYIYLDTILKLNQEFDIHAMMHITGGAFTKLKNLLNNTDVIINNTHQLEPQKIFFELYKKGIADKEMYKIFNCGIGFILSINKKDANAILDKIKNFKADIIGEVVSGSGKVQIQSKFSNQIINY